MDKLSIPEGYCQCGCGQKTNICRRNCPERGWFKDKPYRYISGHRRPPVDVEALLERYLAQDWEYPAGECQCGCGQQTKIAGQNNEEHCHVKGKPFRYILGHHMAFHVRYPEIGRLPQGHGYCLDRKSVKAIEYMKLERSRPGRYRNQCIECALKFLTEYLAQHADHGKRRHLKTKFKLSLEQYEAMLDKQNGVCAICRRVETSTHKGKLRSLAVDHCHVSGRIRGLLCMNCNMALGKFKHDTEILKWAIEYLATY